MNIKGQIRTRIEAFMEMLKWKSKFQKFLLHFFRKF
jgi:hypothetical protein